MFYMICLYFLATSIIHSKTSTVSSELKFSSSSFLLSTFLSCFLFSRVPVFCRSVRPRLSSCVVYCFSSLFVLCLVVVVSFVFFFFVVCFVFSGLAWPAMLGWVWQGWLSRAGRVGQVAELSWPGRLGCAGFGGLGCWRLGWARWGWLG